MAEAGVASQYASGTPTTLQPGPGYVYDPVQGKYVLSSQSAPSKNALYDQLTSAISGLGGASGGSGGGSAASFPKVSFGGSMGSVATTGAGSVPDITPSQNAAFARAKDTAGGLARSSVTSLNDEMAGRGALGSTMTNNGLADRIAAATNTLGNVDSAQLGDAYAAASHQQDLKNQNEQTAFQGAITQRGQDVSMANASAALAQQKQLALLSALKGLSADPTSGLY